LPINIEENINQINIVDQLEEDTKNKIASELAQGVDSDLRSRDPWYESNKEYLKMALQIKERKSFPWPNASNVKYPLITVASLQFQARAYSGIVDSKNFVKGKVTGYDIDGKKAERAERVSKHMTYQLLDKIENWDEDMDRLLLILPVSGSVFKKVYWNSRYAKEAIDLILPQDIIVNYWATSLRTARRITHQFDLYHEDLTSRQKEGIYTEKVDVPDPAIRTREVSEDKLQRTTPVLTDSMDVPHKMWEIHTKLDLDEDGILEPYIVTLTKESRQILRLAPNYDTSGIIKNSKGEIVEIKARDYFVHYKFIPSPDGGFYGVGFGLLLGHLNETASTLINQLIDSGTMATTAGGFLSKQIKLKGGHQGFQPNEWKQVSFTGDDLRKSIMPLPVREPSPVLFQLLGFIDQKGSQIISISEISTGKLPGQNTPAATTLTSVEEGLKLFTSIYKRVYRSLKEELRLLFRINKEKLTAQEYFQILDTDGTFRGEQVTKEDYNDDIDVIPVADPNAASDALRLIKAQQLVELIPIGAVDPVAAGQRIIEAMDIPRPQELQPKPQVDPKVQAMQMKAQMDQQKSQTDIEAEKQKMMFSFIEKQLELKFKAQELQMEMQSKQMDMKFKQIESMLDMRATGITHVQNMQQQQQQHEFNMESGKDNLSLQKEKNNMKREEMKSSGSNSGNKRNKQGRLS